jgi:hypothetical protein
MGFVINPYLFAVSGGGATPTLEGDGGIAGSATASIDVAYPAGVAANDIAFLHCYVDNAAGAQTIQTPAGWTLVDQEPQNANTSTSNALFWKRLTGSESGTQTVDPTTGLGGSDSFCGCMSVWRGAVASGTPYEGLANNTGGSTTLTGAQVTTTGPNRRVLHFGGHSGTATATPAVNWTEAYDYQITNGTPDAGLKCYLIEQASAGAVGPATHTLSVGRGWQVIAVALIPA